MRLRHRLAAGLAGLTVLQSGGLGVTSEPLEA